MTNRLDGRKGRLEHPCRWLTLAVHLRGQLGADGPAALRVAIAGAAGIIAAILTDANVRLAYAPAVGWITAATVYLAWTWRLVLPMGAAATQDHAQNHEKDGSRRPAHVLVLTASLASLAGVGYLLIATRGDTRDLMAGGVGILSVAASWFAVHTIYGLRYAQLYYTAPEQEPPPIDFNGEQPAYFDFGYLAFTIGMCYGVSDTNLTNRKLRTVVLAHAALSYLLGTVIIATTLNLVSDLAN